MIFSDKMQEIATKMGFTFKDYLQTLEEEHKKVLMFQRELPLCLELVTQAIDYCKKELSMTTEEYFHGDELECSEQTSSEEIVPILEEFIPLKKNSSSILEEKKSHQNNMEKENLCQSDWLRSAQLWNQISSDPIPTHNQDLHEKTSVEETCFVEVKRNSGAFQPFQREKTVNKIDNNHEHDQSPAGGGGASSSSTAETASAGSGGSSKREEKKKENHRKQRRCWSPELHRRFLHALQQLGGSHVATPKQIRESMEVDGLTNDEVKSHLQKYRLHTRRPSPKIHNNDGAQPPQFLVVGGIWVPAPEYAAMATTVVATSPPPVTQALASRIHRPKPKVYGQSNSGSGGGVGVAGAVHCNSPATSSSTPISTISHVS